MLRREWLIPLLLLATLAGVGLLVVGRAGESAPAGTEHRAGDARAQDSLTAPGVPDEVERFLRNGQSWRAARVMRDYLEGERDPSPAAVLVAARAEAGWGGWDRVREYLEGRDWLDSLRAGEGWYWLARAREEDGELRGALEAYTRFLRNRAGGDDADRRVVAELRRGLILLREGESEEGARLLQAAREHAPDIAPWVDLLAAGALAERGDTARVRELLDPHRLPEVRRRAARARLTAHERANDPAGARAVALSLRAGADSDGERTELSHQAGRLALELGDTAAALRELRDAVRAAPGTSGAREAATVLARLPGLGPDDQLALASVWERHGNRPRAVAALRAWLGAARGSAAERDAVRLRIGRALFGAGEYADAEAALRPLLGGSGTQAAEAMLLTGRAQYRRGQRAGALTTFMRLAQRFPGTESGSEGLFFVADLSHDAGETSRAASQYRRVADEFPGTDRAGLSLMRLAGIRFLAREYGAAAQVWGEYRTRYPGGERWLQSTYWQARARAAAGDSAAARELYRAVRERDPLSYYALRSAERLGEPYWPIPLRSAPAEDSAARLRVQGWMHGVDLLREAGLFEEAEAEVDRRVRAAGDDPALLYPLAETLNERGYTVRGIRIGQRLQRAEPVPNPRLLRILYPFPYRPMVEAEASEKRLDPFLVAALTRQESLFKARISSPVGARGLMQIMPATGEPLARAAGIRQWDPELLFQPEINVHLGTRFLADQMDRYDGALPAVFSAYNAGPHRIDRWMRFPEYRRDLELFTERIPYRETRDYVKILTRNRALYQGLYGAERAGADGSGEG